MPESKTSVVMPAYQAQDHIERCLLSIEAQDRQADEIVIAVDGCRDTLDAIQTLTPESLRGRTRVLWIARNCGAVGRVYNTAMVVATGDVLVCFDADDEMLPNFIASMAAVVESGKVALARQRVMIGDVVDKEEFVCTGMSMSRIDFLRAGGHEPWPCEEDSELKQRLQQMGIKAYAPKEVNMLRHKEPGSITLSGTAGMGTERQLYFRGIKERRKSEPVVLDRIAITPFEEVNLWAG